MRPMFPYYGSKWYLSKFYPRPTYDTIIEPFAGSAGYSIFNNARRAVLYDADPIIVGVWQYLISADPKEILALPELPEVGDSVDNYSLADGAKWLIGFWLNRGSAQPKKSRTAYSARTDKRQLNWGWKAKWRIAEQLWQVKRWHVELADYKDAIGTEATWFIDPPYGDKGRFYKVGFSDHKELGRWCQSRRGQVIVCSGPEETWLPFSHLGSFKTSKGRAEEWVWVQAT